MKTYEALFTPLTSVSVFPYRSEKRSDHAIKVQIEATRLGPRVQGRLIAKGMKELRSTCPFKVGGALVGEMKDVTDREKRVAQAFGIQHPVYNP